MVIVIIYYHKQNSLVVMLPVLIMIVQTRVVQFRSKEYINADKIVLG